MSNGYYVMLVTGGRDFKDESAVTATLERLVSLTQADGRVPVVMAGGARGADALAMKVAKRLSIRTEKRVANWKRDGKKAGFVRNNEMLAALETARSRGNETVVVHFPGGSGTHHMVEIARSAGIRVCTPTPVPVPA